MFEHWTQRTPVIVGVGECVDRSRDPEQCKEPLTLLAEALRGADDGTGGLLGKLDSLDVVRCMTWGYKNLPVQLCESLHIHPRRVEYGAIGGETPISYIHQAAIRIAQGDVEVAAVCGAEAASSLLLAQQSKARLPWTPEESMPEQPRREGILHPVALQHGLNKPLVVYPIYEYASCAAWNQSLEDGRTETSRLWSQFSGVAVQNSSAWIRRFHEPCEISTPAPNNRRVAGPYTKLMVANPIVNQGGAVILTSLASAMAMGIPEDRMVYVWGGSAASEPADFVSRDQYCRSSAMEAVLASGRELARKNNADLDVAELYSCFPCVPKMARRVLEWPADKIPTLAGGLTFFGGPYNNYMTHASAAMVRALRENRAAVGLLYGQGGFVTKHHALVLGTRPPADPVSHGYDVQTRADRWRGPIPALDENYIGHAHVETYTILYDRHGEAEYAVVFARNDEGARILARVEGKDADTLALLTDPVRSAIGVSGKTRQASDGTLRWSA